MLEKKPIDFYYFSGTGNTYLIVKSMKDAFEKQGFVVNLLPLVNFVKSEFNDKHIIGIAFPIAAMGTYPLCWEFLKKLPQTNGTKVFMVDTLAGFSGGIIGPVRKILTNKGFETIGVKEIIMPSNYLVKKKQEEKNSEIIDAGKKEAQKFVEDIVSGNSRWGRVPIFSDLLSFPSKSGKAWELMRNWTNIAVNNQLCTQCSLCEKACPINNINLES